MAGPTACRGAVNSATTGPLCGCSSAGGKGFTPASNARYPACMARQETYRRQIGITAARESSRAGRRARLPRFLVAEPVGLGDVVKRVTTAVGVKPCTACQQRAARLNEWLQFTPRS